VITARFDDLAPRGRSFELRGPVAIVEARQPSEVADALSAVEASTQRGYWAAGFCSYEAAPGLDPAFAVRPRPRAEPFSELPLVWFALFEESADVALPSDPSAEPPSPLDAWVASIARERYDGAIEAIREHIAAGEAYQINYTLRLRAAVDGDERGLYRDLCLAQRGSYAAYLNLGRYRVLSASPELFFRLDDDRVTTRPMKGTAPRGRWAEEDEDVARRLRSSAKDRAENAMIVDLLRNDLGRISIPGSVETSAMFAAERYETIWQLTSTVTSRLRPGAGLLDVFRAVFPSGSVTGAPKIRSSQIIAALEDSPRGVYTGAIGYVAPSAANGPRARFNVAIRTVVLDTETRLAEYGVGGGITTDSSAEGEYDEVLAKARVLTLRRPAFDLFETVRHDPGVGFRHLHEHLERLSASARYFGFRCDVGAVTEALEKVVTAEDAPVAVRVVLSRDGDAFAEPRPLSRRPSAPPRLAIDRPSVDPSDALVYHKTTIRGRYESAAARHPEADDVVLVNTRDEVAECTVANLAARLRGRWWTPALDAGLLPGIERMRALADGRIQERTISVAEIRAAEELALLSSVRGWRRAILLDDPSG
jgi:para-aminobenzoate synthetase / 4-amino-4-deoxychorismate lyase